MDFQTPSTPFFDFISSNIYGDPKNLLLKNHGKSFDFNVEFAITQIECRQKGKHKLPHLISNPNIIFPTSLAYEQASHERVAAYHASLVKTGSKVVDMTAGLGIDAMAFAENKCNVTACEYDPLKADVLRYNAGVLKLDNLTVVNIDSIKYIKEMKEKCDVIFIDPARRSKENRRLYNLHDCTPDILGIMDSAIKKCTTLIIKASPLLDISQTLKDIPATGKISAVSVGGECKEVLIIAENGASVQTYEAIDLSTDGRINYQFSFSPSHDGRGVEYSEKKDVLPGRYLYEPGAAVMKLNPWSELCTHFPGIKKLSQSSHLFVSHILFESFPGRILRIDSLPDKKSRQTLKGSPANVVTRNYPLSTEELRKNLGVKEGNDQFIYGTRLGKTPILIAATRIRI
ncbi:MAG: class I SAM-dependent methyltransferase [Bacteroides sp.]|nr:class I SAM-dependent methyltransferase [Bacteroides sp.]